MTIRHPCMAILARGPVISSLTGKSLALLVMQSNGMHLPRMSWGLPRSRSQVWAQAHEFGADAARVACRRPWRWRPWPRRA